MIKYGNPKSIREEVNLIRSSEQPFIIFGASDMLGIIAKFVLEHHNKAQICFCDNDVKKQGKPFLNYPVWSPEEAFLRYPDGVVCLCLSKELNILKVADQLSNLGFSHFVKMDAMTYVYSIDVMERKLNSEVFLQNVHAAYFNFDGAHLTIPVLSTFITERCNLSCDNCSVMSSQYNPPQQYEKTLFLKDLNVVLDAVEGIRLLSFFGGEPLLSMDFIEMCEAASYQDKIVEINVITNGSIVPSDEELLRFKKCVTRFVISNYEVCARETEQLIRKLEYFHIAYCLIDACEEWYVHDEPKNTNMTQLERYQTYEQCTWGEGNCITLKNGKLFKCVIAAVYYDHGHLKENCGDYMQLSSEPEFKERLCNYLSAHEGIQTCACCGIDFSRKCQRGIQVK